MDAATGGGDEAFNGRGVETACEFFFFGFDTGDDGHCEELFIDAAVEVEDFEDFGVGFGFGEVRGVTLLPEELAGTEEGLCESALVLCRNV